MSCCLWRPSIFVPLFSMTRTSGLLPANFRKNIKKAGPSARHFSICFYLFSVFFSLTIIDFWIVYLSLFHKIFFPNQSNLPFLTTQKAKKSGYFRLSLWLTDGDDVKNSIRIQIIKEVSHWTKCWILVEPHEDATLGHVRCGPHRVVLYISATSSSDLHYFSNITKCCIFIWFNFAEKWME